MVTDNSVLCNRVPVLNRAQFQSLKEPIKIRALVRERTPVAFRELLPQKATQPIDALETKPKKKKKNQQQKNQEKKIFLVNKKMRFFWAISHTGKHFLHKGWRTVRVVMSQKTCTKIINNLSLCDLVPVFHLLVALKSKKSAPKFFTRKKTNKFFPEPVEVFLLILHRVPQPSGWSREAPRHPIVLRISFSHDSLNRKSKGLKQRSCAQLFQVRACNAIPRLQSQLIIQLELLESQLQNRLPRLQILPVKNLFRGKILPTENLRVQKLPTQPPRAPETQSEKIASSFVEKRETRNFRRPKFSLVSNLSDTNSPCHFRPISRRAHNPAKIRGKTRDFFDLPQTSCGTSEHLLACRSESARVSKSVGDRRLRRVWRAIRLALEASVPLQRKAQQLITREKGDGV